MTPRAYTHPSVLTLGAEQGWADPETDPALIDWPARQAAALIPFDVRDGRPVTPFPRHTAIPRGRNRLGRWGENPMADAIVLGVLAGREHLLMVERGDGLGWAVPGGSIEPGEDGLAAAVRELAEETGLALDPATGRQLPPRHVMDPRASDEAWAVTVPVLFFPPPAAELPPVAGGDDAARAEWARADSYTGLEARLEALGGQVFAAHVSMLRDVLGGGA